MDSISAVMEALTGELVATVGDDDTLRDAAGQVAMWAAFTDPHTWAPLRPSLLCRRGLIGGHAYDLEVLEGDAERMERAAAALRLLIAHTEATHPLARQRRRRRAAAAAG